MKNSGFKFKRKKVLVFSFEGKNNKTESIYFSHFEPSDKNFILRCFSSGVTDPVKMLSSTKAKRKILDYNAKEDRTYIFMDGDNDLTKINIIKNLKKTLPKDIKIIVSNPSFEVWFLNHFIKTTRQFLNGDEVIKELDKHIKNYQKNNDYINRLIPNMDIAIENSEFQLLNKDSSSYVEVVELFNDGVISHKE